MMKLILCLLLIFGFQSDSSVFWVETVGTNSEYDSRYILNNILEFISQEKPFRESEIKSNIDCLVAELKASGIFEDVKAELRPTKRGNANARSLIVDVTYRPEIESFVISGIVLVGFPEIDNARFQAALGGTGVKPGAQFLKYYYHDLELNVGEALAKAHKKRPYRGPYWIAIRSDGNQRVKLIVSPASSGCKSSTGISLDRRP